MPDTTDALKDTRPIWEVVIPAGAVIAVLCVLIYLYPVASKIALDATFSFISNNFGSFYLWFNLFLTGLAAFFIFSRYGNIKFGPKGEAPQFSNMKWISMMFCAGVAGAVMFWSIAEPLYNLNSPPRHLEPLSLDAFKWSTTYVLFHWGPFTWVWYVICSLPICYMYYKRGTPLLRLSAACEDGLGKRLCDKVGPIIDIAFCIGLIASNTAVMGISIPIVANALAAVFGIEPTIHVQLICLVVGSLIFTVSVALGLEKGASRLAAANVFIALAMIFFALVVGPTRFIFDNFTNAVGTIFSHYFEMSLATDPHDLSEGAAHFPQTWTIFYSLWMASYGPFMGLFIARISKGRTVRQIVSMGVICGVIGSWLIHSVFGGFTLHLQLTNTFDAAGHLAQFKNPTQTVVMVLSYLPMKSLVLIGYCLFSTIFLATSLDASASSLAAACTRRLGSDGQPSMPHRFFWAVLTALLPAVLLYLESIEPMKTFGNVSGACMILVIIPLLLSWFMMLKSENAVALKYDDLAQASGSATPGAAPQSSGVAAEATVDEASLTRT
ncbi:MAG: BCCT family transporter [Desulfovibrio sp.]|jgi:BCCT family betaine/carnitine transporter|nr:BCCT family transporter [Desulfovibrio sp.]